VKETNELLGGDKDFPLQNVPVLKSSQTKLIIRNTWL